MTEARPLLPFGPPRVGSIPVGPPRPIPQPRASAGRQGQRLAPQFQALSDAFAAGRIATSVTADESDPELVVVFDLAGTVQDFARAVRDVAGLEFLSEMADEEVDPDDDFHMLDSDGSRVARPLDHTLFAIMANARAASELVRLFGLWTNDRSADLPEGTAPLRRAFEQLRSVRRWGPEDRIRDTGLLDEWEEHVEVKGAYGVERVEIELWFRAAPSARRAAELHVTELVAAVGGTTVNRSVKLEIGYHALLVDLPAQQVEAVMSAGPDSIALLRTETIMLMSPAEPTPVVVGVPSQVSLPSSPPEPLETRPRVALFDGMPLANHAALAGRVIVDDPDEVEPAYPVAARRHGTAMASLICHGDLSDPGPALSAQLYVRPVMEADDFHNEKIVRSELLVDLLHRCFLRIFEGPNPTAPSVRIVNLSLGDPARVFVRRVGALARMVDWLAHHYNVVILVSAGNHPLPPSIPAESAVSEQEVRSAMLSALRSESIHRRILAPGESINALTIGATHVDASSPPENQAVIDAVAPGMPAAYSAVGSGFKRAIKPEIFVTGGRQIFQRPLPDTAGQTNLLPASQQELGPGLLAAAPGIPLGRATAFGYGTSHATALATRACDSVFTVLESLPREIDDRAFPDPQYHPVLSRALMVHASGWSGMDDSLRELDPSLQRRHLALALGYGRLDAGRLADATRTRVCLLGAGRIGDKQRHTFTLPKPDAIRATKEWRRIIVTLAWISPTHPRNLTYRVARLSAGLAAAEFGVAGSAVTDHASRRGTVQHQVYEGRKSLGFVSGENAVVEVDCRFTRGVEASPVRYGIAVSIEMAATVQADVHGQVRNALRVRDRVRTGATS